MGESATGGLHVHTATRVVAGLSATTTHGPNEFAAAIREALRRDGHDLALASLRALSGVLYAASIKTEELRPIRVLVVVGADDLGSYGFAVCRGHSSIKSLADIGV